MNICKMQQFFKEYKYIITDCILEEGCVCKEAIGIIKKFPEIKVYIQGGTVLPGEKENAKTGEGLLRDRPVRMSEFTEFSIIREGHSYLCEILETGRKELVVRAVLEFNSRTNTGTTVMADTQEQELFYTEADPELVMLFKKAYGFVFHESAAGFFVKTPVGHWRIPHTSLTLYHENHTCSGIQTKGFHGAYHKQALPEEMETVDDLLKYIVQHDIAYGAGYRLKNRVRATA